MIRLIPWLRQLLDLFLSSYPARLLRDDAGIMHLAAFVESVDAAAAFNSLNAVTDDVIRTQDTRIFVPSLSQVVAVAAGVGAGGNGIARLFAPSLRDRPRVVITPVNGRNDGNVEPSSPQIVTDRRQSPLVLAPNEALQAEIHSDTTAAAIQWVLVWFADGPVGPVTGSIFTIRATGTTTLVANTWTQVALTFDEELQVGTYQVVGLRGFSAGCIGVRILPVGGGFKAGVLGVDAHEDLEHPMFRGGQMGVMHTFSDPDLPSVEFLSLSADTAETVFFDLIKTG